MARGNGNFYIFLSFAKKSKPRQDVYLFLKKNREKMVEIKDQKPEEVTAESIKKLYNIGYRNFIASDYSEAADALQEVCRWK